MEVSGLSSETVVFKLHGIISQKTEISIFTAVRTSNLIDEYVCFWEIH
jgi:hypothetical protein